MTRMNGLSGWMAVVSTSLPPLSRPQALTLALWSWGMVVTQNVGLTSVSAFLALVLGHAEPAVRERLRYWYRARVHAHKRAQRQTQRRYRRRELEVQTCFPWLLRWVVAWWDPQHPYVPIVLDASTLGQRFTILAVCVVIRGCAIPVAWAVVEATTKGAWKPHWERLLATLDGIIPPAWTVLVLADRGLYAKWLFHGIQANGWHPFLRINRQGQYCRADETTFQRLRTVVTAHGETWAGAVTCFKTRDRQLPCTLLARWDAGYRDPWLIVTDLPPDAADVAWYGLRTWIECGFKDSKRGGWHWEQTKMQDPRRAEWLWLVIAVTMLWTVAVGCVAEEAASQAGDATRAAASRSLSCMRRGQLGILASMCMGQAVPAARFVPEPWPKSLDTNLEDARPRSKAA